jgi:hypothetical protein
MYMPIDGGKDEQVSLRRRRFSEAWEAFTREVDLTELNIDPDEVFGGLRDNTPGERNSSS